MFILFAVYCTVHCELFTVILSHAVPVFRLKGSVLALVFDMLKLTELMFATSCWACPAFSTFVGEPLNPCPLNHFHLRYRKAWEKAKSPPVKALISWMSEAGQQSS